jgi:serine/threonine protein kinase
LPLIAPGEQPSIAHRRLGHFELIEAIGAGGMAAVLKARDLELGRIVALKILPPEAAKDPESVTRFKQEARAAALLDHENVARVYYCGEDQGLHFIAFEFVEGENLRVLIDRRGTIPAADCIRYMIQVAAGLTHAAERGVVHRDIKPSNIIISPDGRAKIVDMGLARHLDSLSVNGGVTQSGVTLGTFDYISPEQALDPRRADVRSDIYSLGCTFYHALTGRPPVPEGTAAKKLYAHQHIDPPDPRLLNHAIPDGLAAILSGMMAKDPDRRFQTPTALISHLKGLMAELKLGAESLPSDSVVRAVPATPPVPTLPPHLKLSWVLGATAFALLIAAFAMSGGDPGSRPVAPPWATERLDSPDEVPHNAFTTLRPADRHEDGVRRVKTARELADLLAKHGGTVRRVELEAGQYDLTDFKEPAGDWKSLELVGSSHGQTTILLPGPSGDGLVLKVAESLSVSGIRFVLPHDSGAGEDQPGRMVGMTIQSAKDVQFNNCSFFDPSCSLFNPLAVTKERRKDDAVAVAVIAADDSPLSEIGLTGCAFGPVVVAVQAPGHAQVKIEDCGFAARTCVKISALREAGGDLSPAVVNLLRSSFMLDPDCAVVEAEGKAELTAGYCVFAAAGKAQGTSPLVATGTVLLATGKDAQATVAGVVGKKNVFYRVNPVTVGSGTEVQQVTSLDDWKPKKPGDKDVVELKERPWAVGDVASALNTRAPWTAFALRIDSEPAVFVDEPSPKVVVVGAVFQHEPTSNRGQAYPSAVVVSWPPVKPSADEPGQKVWVPSTTGAAGLHSLLQAARHEDVILIQHNGDLPIEAMELRSKTPGADFHVTFKPAPGFKPILTAFLKNAKLDQPLFQLTGGAVSFEGLHFLLKATVPNGTVTAVAVVGGKGCTFTDCSFTLAEEDGSKAAAVVQVRDPERIMAMAEGGARPVPEISFKNCVIRGKGRGVWVEDGRTVRVDMQQSLSAVNGPLFLAEPGVKPAQGSRSTLRLTRNTALVGGPLVELIGTAKPGEMRASGLPQLDVHAEECLFAAVPGAGQTLVLLEKIDREDAKTLLEWQGKSNRYANFDDSAPVLVVHPEGANPSQADWTEWFDLVVKQIADKSRGKVVFAAPAAIRLEDLKAIKPDDVRVKEVMMPGAPEAKPDDAGVNRPLPTPPAVSGEEPKGE